MVGLLGLMGNYVVLDLQRDLHGIVRNAAHLAGVFRASKADFQVFITRIKLPLVSPRVLDSRSTLRRWSSSKTSLRSRRTVSPRLSTWPSLPAFSSLETPMAQITVQTAFWSSFRLFAIYGPSWNSFTEMVWSNECTGVSKGRHFGLKTTASAPSRSSKRRRQLLKMWLLSRKSSMDKRG